MPSNKRFLTRLEVEDMTEGKRKHVSLSIEEKLTELKKIAGGASLASIAKEYGITLDSLTFTLKLTVLLPTLYSKT